MPTLNATRLRVNTQTCWSRVHLARSPRCYPLNLDNELKVERSLVRIRFVRTVVLLGICLWLANCTKRRDLMPARFRLSRSNFLLARCPHESPESRSAWVYDSISDIYWFV